MRGDAGVVPGYWSGLVMKAVLQVAVKFGVRFAACEVFVKGFTTNFIKETLPQTMKLHLQFHSASWSWAGGLRAGAGAFRSGKLLREEFK